jgi:hypothetical protein
VPKSKANSEANSEANRQSYSRHPAAQDLAESGRAHKQEKAAAVERLEELGSENAEKKKDVANTTDFMSKGMRSRDWDKVDEEHVWRRDDKAAASAQIRLASRAK